MSRGKRKRQSRVAHGRSAECGRLTASEAQPWDELATGVQAPVQAEAGSERTAEGTWVKGAHTAQSKGGKARRDRTKLSHETGLAAVAGEESFAPYRRQAKDFTRAECAAIAASVGGGVCGAGPSSIVASAALALAAARWCFDHADGDPDMMIKGTRLADSSRAALRDARHLAALEAEARPRPNPLAALRASLGVETK